MATATASDDEMESRIRRHRSGRPPDWTVIEEPVDLVGAIEGVEPGATLVVDCLALWVANRMDAEDASILAAAESVAHGLRARSGASIVVTNEVGSGVVPPTPSGRRFRDLLGTVNQRLAAAADDAYLVVAGRLLALADPRSP